MWTDAIDLREFYASSLGQVARRMVSRRLRVMWPDLRGQRILGLGYATPYLRPFRDEAERVLAVMPAAQGVVHWPPEGPNATALAEEAELPFADASIDRVLLVHALEFSEELRPMLREVWRVLSGGGRLIAVVPNRRGIWARFDHTPFGHGHPYTASQLKRLLRETLFSPLDTQAALYMPPLSWRMMLSSAAAWEKLGDRWFQRVAGAVMVEASKQLYAPQTAGARRQRRRAYAPAPQAAGRAALFSAQTEGPRT